MGDGYARISVTLQTITPGLLCHARTSWGGQFYIGHFGWTGLRIHNCTVRKLLQVEVLSFVWPDVISCIWDLAKWRALGSARSLLDSRGHDRLSQLKDPWRWAPARLTYCALWGYPMLISMDEAACLSTCTQVLLKFSSTTNS